MSGINVGTIVRRVHAGAAMVFVLVGAIGSVLADDRAIFVTSPGQPLNVGDAMLAATAYHDSGAYDRDLALVARRAGQWIAERAPLARRPALVLDVDDTSLSNWEVIVRDDFGRPIGGPCDLALDAPCGWAGTARPARSSAGTRKSRRRANWARRARPSSWEASRSISA